MYFDFGALNDAELVILVVAGLLLLFAGYRVKKIAFYIVWFLIGYFITIQAMPLMGNVVPEIVGNDIWQNLLPIAGGLLMGMIGFSIEKVCVGGAAFGVVLIITAQYFGTDMQTMLIGAVIGIVAAGAAVMLMKPATIIVTSVAGAYVLTNGILHFAPGLPADTAYFPILLGSSAIGAVVQFVTSKHY
ncbi:DUF4203 domain-containing protein [Candidatus Saccharibacteria bacterium]|nr:DUF4203 domain-containing protein [Candidatus Saccharibacteria bacterium]